jgi:hypothetical protein
MTKFRVKDALRLVVLANQFVLVTSPLRLTTSNFLFNWSLAVIVLTYVTTSLTRRRVCCLQLLLVLAIAAILGFEPRGTYHILLFQIRDSPNLEGHIAVFISSRNRVAQFYPRHWVLFFFSRLPWLAGLLWKYSKHPSRRFDQVLTFFLSYNISRRAT